MQTSGLKHNAISRYGRFVAIALIALFFTNTSFAQSAATPTTINVSDTTQMTGTRRLGVNLGTQNFWDSGMFMRNLTFRNPGFEGETWQSIIHCISVTSNTCTDDNPWTYWPANFLSGASAEFIVGGAVGATGTVSSNTAATIAVVGSTLTFTGLTHTPSVGDYLVVRKHVPGNAPAGWWYQTTGGAALSTEYTDLSPETPGKQALRITAASGQTATLSSYMDSTSGKSFIRLNGTYTLTFRAKGTGGANKVNLAFFRTVTSGSALSFFNQDVTLTNAWKDYSFTINPQDTTGQIGTLALNFTVNGSSMLIDDVALTAAASSTNPTAYRNEVVNSLKTLHPGTLRYMDSGTNWGSSIDNLLAPDFARERAGYSNRNSEMDDIALGLPDFLVLCETIGAEPWFTMPTGMSTQEMSNLMDYLGGSTSTVYGAKRAALGQTAPWTSVFSTIHLEFGNEVWNTSNPGASMNDATSYGKRAGAIFTAAKASASYSAKSFDFIQDGFQAIPYWTQQGLASSSNYDTVDVAAYLFGEYNDASSIEHTFGPMLGEPESIVDVSTGLMAQQAVVAAGAPKAAKLAVYETNMGTISGAVTQAQVQTAIPSLGAGIAVAENMLITQRDLGVNNQNMFALEGYSAPFSSTAAASPATTSPIWGVAIDMGGPTNRVRPMFLSEQLANSAILPNMLAVSQAGANPTWNQTYTTNDAWSMNGVHYIQSMAYTDGTTLNVILFNLSRTTALPVKFSGLNAPVGAASISTLTAAAIDATNETAQNVAITSTSQTLAVGSVLTLAPYSMTVVSVAAPAIPITITSLTTTCDRSSLSPSDTTNCTAKVAGDGKYNSAVTWTANVGTISSSGVYTAPATIPASKTATITATSVQDSTKSYSLTLPIAADSVTGVTASCASTSINQAATTTCSAAVTGTGGFSSAYTWSVSGGSITSAGAVTAPSTGNTMTVTATSTENPAKSASVVIKLSAVLVMGSPSASTTNTSATITWPLNMAAYSGITYGATPALGLSTPYNPSTSTSPSLTLTGLSPNKTYYLVVYSFLGNQTVSKSISVTPGTGVGSITGITLGCASSSVSAGSTIFCSPTVTGTGNYSSAVTWSTSAGSITSAGVLTAPTTDTSVKVTATSTQDKTKSASATITVTPSATVTGLSVTCAASSLVEGGATTCGATVTGTGSYSSAVNWSTSAGTITSGGVLTAPTTATSIKVTATSAQDSTKSASATINVTGSAAVTGVSVICAASTLSHGAITACVASVAGTGSYSSAVKWSASAGTITSAGLFTAPASGTSATITATSTQTPTKSASATISIASPLTISNPVATATSNSITVSWTSNIPANAGVTYGPTGALGSTTPYSSVTSTNPSFTIRNLQPSTGVTLVVYSFVNGQTATKTITVVTSPATKVSSVSAVCGTTPLAPGATTTCTSVVKGTGDFSTAVTWTASAGTITPAGVFTAPASGTTAIVKATSAQDLTISGVATISLKQPLAIVNPIISATPTTVVVSWAVTQAAHNGVDYGLNTGYGSTTPYIFETNAAPSFSFTGLKPGTTYYAYIFSFNDSGEVVGKPISITTPLK